MRRLISIAAFALLLTVPLWAQRGGGHGGGGVGHAGFGGGHGGFGGGHVGGFGGRGGRSFGGSHFSGAGRSFSHAGRGLFNPSRSGFHRGPFLHDGFRHSRLHRYGFRNNCYGWRCGNWGWGGGYPWWGWDYYPWWWDQDDYEFDQDYYRQYDLANQMNEQSLEQQRMLRQEEADGDQDAYAARHDQRSAPESAPASDPPATSIISPTVLVFRDQHREEVQNYAIVGQTLWNFAPQHTQKIPLANLDLSATEKANDDRGVTFGIPGSNEGQ